MIRLLNCRWCGAGVDAKLAAITASSGNLEGWQAMCPQCGAGGPVRDKMEDAAKDWNQVMGMAGQVGAIAIQ